VTGSVTNDNKMQLFSPPVCTKAVISQPNPKYVWTNPTSNADRRCGMYHQTVQGNSRLTNADSVSQWNQLQMHSDHIERPTSADVVLCDILASEMAFHQVSDLK